ncbi:hypothetical protein SLS60_007407 [Paraconiothyrium brasiliense]|uniref:Myb-like DNA-binding protein n=1 Tax=Paraconiothyrium brasiliense TaxID=300254 RepID=A0ABR3R594_9PLEO
MQKLLRKHTSLLHVENLEAMFPGRRYKTILAKFGYERRHNSNLCLQSKRRFSPEEDKLLIEAKSAGERWPSILKKFPDRNPDTVMVRWYDYLSPSAKALRAANRAAKPTRWSSEEQAEMRRLRDAGLGWSEIAVKLGRVADIVRCHYADTVPPERRSGNFYRVRPWTQEERKTVEVMRDSGKSFQDIGKVLGRQPEACSAQYYLSKDMPPLEKPHWTEEETALLKAALKDGIPNKRIKVPGKSTRAIQARIDRLGLNRRRRWTSAEDAVIEAAIQEGLTTSQIASRLPGRTRIAITGRRSLIATGKVTLK